MRLDIELHLDLALWPPNYGLMIRALVIAVLFFATPSLAREGIKAPPGQFDYMLLSLSWSPKYCADQGGRADAELQCAGPRKFGFVVHGLWPQFDDGSWPQSCANTEVPRKLVDAMLDLMPSSDLVRHEWRKHGTCSGLSPERYFGTIRSMMGRITIPERYRDPAQPVTIGRVALINDFIEANKALGLEKRHLALKCKGKDLVELAICFSADGQTPWPCGKTGFQCKSGDIRLLEQR